ncbi:MAG: DEAD/DEAH box helicase family protein [Elusimicrobia bacterium]|nr:DEAD/DEAH box helicase family protein [Elusimicrobiota bacterium]
MSSFITNDTTKNLKKRLLDLISKSEELKFLVGFFYFSGIRELYDGLKNNSNVVLKVLVGLNVDKTIYGLIEYGDKVKISDEEKAYNFFNAIIKSLNTEDFDNKEFYEQIKFFIEMIKNDRLIIRKTFEPNHSKIYIFKLEETQVGRKELFITGSSNLTRAGIVKQNEFNVEISDYGFKDAEDYFDNLWERAVKITEFEDFKKKLIDLIENKTLVKQISPFEAYLLVLKNYLLTSEKKEDDENIKLLMKEKGYQPYQYQIDAIQQAISIIDENNGVILADVVGLGKTVIACLIARMISRMSQRGIVICPPGIIGDDNKTYGWKKYLNDFDLNHWDVRSVGELVNGELLEYIQRNKNIEFVIVDEAHRFRNQDTKSYEQLKNICRGKKVILLTATPFNNRPADILSILKLFITPKKSTITLENNLVDKFSIFKSIFDKLSFIKKHYNSTNSNKRQKSQNLYRSLFGEDEIDLKKVSHRTRYLAKQIRNVIEPVIIRRNRLDLQKNPHFKDEIKTLTKTKDPIEWLFELEKEQSEFYDTIIGRYFADPDSGGLFKGAIYHPFEYEKGENFIEKKELKMEDNRQYMQQRNLYDFMRRLLVKRFESSFGAFKKSLENFKRVTKICDEFIKKSGKFILDRDLIENIYQLGVDEIEEKLIEYAQKIKEDVYPKNYRIYELKFKQKEKFLQDIKSDIKLFDKILDELSELNLVENDPKANCLIEHLKEELNKKPLRGEPERKIVIFSEYADTVKYLQPILEKHFRVLTIYGTVSKHKVSELNENFDASFKTQRNDYDILLTTDKLSEGVNLNRAGMVVNYDIPWNPVRVIQRVGRINRIGKRVFEEICIVNFFPTEKGAELVKSREIAANKMFLIHNTLGEDSKIFDIDEEPTPSGLYKKLQQNPDYAEEESFYVKVLNEYEKLKKEYPEIIKQLDNCPMRVKVSKKGDENELFVFIRKGHLYIRKMNYEKKNVEIVDMEDAIDRIRCLKDERAIDLSDYFWDAYGEIKLFKEKKVPASEQSIERKALNNIKFLLEKTQAKEVIPYKNFLRTFNEDIVEYGTLPTSTLRRIADFEVTSPEKIKKTIEALEKLKKELGEDYLFKEKERLKELRKEIIIAIENRSENNIRGS